jgi:carboxymethylenebutenolidase
MVTFGGQVSGFLAVPEKGAPPFAAVILCHERYGLVQHTLDLAAKFAAHGYIGLAPDMFSHWKGDKVALNRGDVRASLSDSVIRSSLSAGLDFLLKHPKANGKRIAVMGVCQSGAFPLLLNSVRKEVAANIVFYGGAQSREWEINEDRRESYDDILGRLTAPVLGVWGEDDHVIAVDDVCRLRGALEAKRKSYEFKLFPHMPHGWLNSTMPGRYRPTEAEEAWNLVLSFLDRVYAGAFPPDRVTGRFESNIAPNYDFTKNVRLA